MENGNERAAARRRERIVKKLGRIGIRCKVPQATLTGNERMTTTEMKKKRGII